MFKEAAVKTLRAEYRRAVDYLSQREKLDWYRYDSFASVEPIIRLIAAALPHGPGVPSGGIALDLGAGDGAMSFLLERHGFSVDAFDCSGTNINAMKGIAVLRGQLASGISINDIDLDQPGFGLRQFDLTLALGLLYHLKNPWLVLETLARHAHFCVLSSRIIDFLPDGTRIVRR